MVKKINAKIEKNNVDLSEQVKSIKAPSESNSNKKLEKILNSPDNNWKDHFTPASKIVSIEFSAKSIILVIVAILVFLLWQKLMPVVMVFFFAFVLASGFKPIVDWLQTKRLSKLWSIIITYAAFFLFIAIIIGIVLVPFLNEFDALVQALPQLYDKLFNFTDSLDKSNIPFIRDNAVQIRTVIQDSVKSFSSNLIPFLTNSFEGFKVAMGTLADVAGGFIAVLTAIMLSVYMLNDHDYLVGSMLTKFVDYKKHKIVWKLLTDVETKLGSWIVGQFVLSLIIGVMCWVALTILGVPFAIPLAVLAAALESIPNLGPIIAAVPAILIASIDGGANSAIYTTVAYVIIQQLEGALIVPKVMGNAVGIKAIYVLAGIMIGFALGNFVGALVAVPILVILKIGLEFYFDLQRLKAIDRI
jgi:predicted PurR-regulated permease PerM